MLKNRKTHSSLVSFSQRIIILFLMFSIAILCVASSLSYENVFFVYKDENVTVFSSENSDVAAAFSESGIKLDESEYLVMPEYVDQGVAKIYIYPKKKVFVKTEEEENVLYTEKNVNVAELLEENDIVVSEKYLVSIPLEEKVSDGMVIEIIPKKQVIIKIAGAETTAYATPGMLVADFLQENNLVLGENDLISVPITDKITEDVHIEITRISYAMREETQAIPFSTEKRANSSMKKGISKVLQNGQNGEKHVVFKATITNGVETKRDILEETVIKKPVTKIIEYGTDASGVVKTKFGELKYKNVLTMTATAYTTEGSSDKITATGQVAKVGLVAVDRRVIPLGTKMYIEAADGKSWCYGIAVAGDTGVRGNKIDLFFNTRKECINFGVKKAKVYILK